MAVHRPAGQTAIRKFGCLLAAAILLAGCGGSVSLDHGSSSPQAGAELKGSLLGGQFPVTGSEVQLYAAGSSGYGSGAKALLTPAVTTDQNGQFVIPFGAYTCPTGSALTYLVATGGDPGLGSDNPAIVLMATLGACGNIGNLPSVVINEVTTVASVWALAPFLGSGARVGTSSANLQGLTNAFANVDNVVEVTNGRSPGNSAPTGALIPVPKIYTLANVLASCINSTGSTACNKLFNAATPPSGVSPTDTLSAAVDIARNPSNNVAALFALATPQSPFGPGLSAAPSDWTIAVTFNGGGLNYPASIAVDASGKVWAANYCGSNNPCSSVTELSSAGQPLSSKGFTDGSLWESYGLAIDVHGNVWVTNQQTSGVNSGHGSLSMLNTSGSVVSTFYGGGIDFPVAVATYADGSIWSANQGNSTVSKLLSNGSTVSTVSGSSGWGAGHVFGPAAVAVDANHYAWFANGEASSGEVTSISQDGGTVHVIGSGGEGPSGIATDRIGQGHVWVANYTTSSISELELTGTGAATLISTTPYAGGGINHPNGIAVDGSGNVWVANWGGATLTELQGATGAHPGQPLSPSSGFGTDANLREPYGIALDSSGNVWVSNFGSNSVTQFLGAATPVKTPLVGPPQVP